MGAHRVLSPTSKSRPKKMSKAMSKRRLSSAAAKSNSKRRLSSGSDTSNMKPLPEGFVPANKDVIMGRGKTVQNHPGNILYKETIDHYLPHYERAKCKLDKSLIVNSVVATVQENGSFVCEKNGKWFEATELLVRERIGASLRDQLHTRYSSSTKSKKKRRLQAQDKLSDEVEEIISSQDCREIVTRLGRLSQEIEDDDELQLAFNKANMELLVALKKHTITSNNNSPDNTNTEAASGPVMMDESSSIEHNKMLSAEENDEGSCENNTIKRLSSDTVMMIRGGDADFDADDDGPTLMDSLSSCDFAQDILADGDDDDDDDCDMEPIPYAEV